MEKLQTVDRGPDGGFREFIQKNGNKIPEKLKQNPSFYEILQNTVFSTYSIPESMTGLAYACDAYANGNSLTFVFTKQNDEQETLLSQKFHIIADEKTNKIVTFDSYSMQHGRSQEGENFTDVSFRMYSCLYDENGKCYDSNRIKIDYDCKRGVSDDIFYDEVLRTDFYVNRNDTYDISNYYQDISRYFDKRDGIGRTGTLEHYWSYSSDPYVNHEEKSEFIEGELIEKIYQIKDINGDLYYQIDHKRQENGRYEEQIKEREELKNLEYSAKLNYIQDLCEQRAQTGNRSR